MADNNEDQAVPTLKSTLQEVVPKLLGLDCLYVVRMKATEAQFCYVLHSMKRVWNGCLSISTVKGILLFESDELS